MRSPTTAGFVGAILALALVLAAIPVIAQEELERPSVGVPVAGEVRSDGTIVLSDEDFCSYLLSEVFGADTLTYRALIDRTKKQKKAKKAAFQPFTDEATLERCAEILDAFGVEAPEGDTLPPWAREAPVVPESIARLLPADLIASPLAEPAGVGDGARTSGFGDLTSAPFGLPGGAYLVEVNDALCETWSGSMRLASAPAVEAALVDATTYLYGLPAGNYYWDVSAPRCDWSVDVVAFELPPEPTPTPIPKTVVPFLVPGGGNLDRLTVAAAGDLLVQAGLTVNICQVVRDANVAAGLVVSQVPPGGTLVEPGSSIRVHIDFPGNCTELPLTPDAQQL